MRINLLNGLNLLNFLCPFFSTQVQNPVHFFLIRGIKYNSKKFFVLNSFVQGWNLTSPGKVSSFVINRKLSNGFGNGLDTVTFVNQIVAIIPTAPFTSVVVKHFHFKKNVKQLWKRQTIYSKNNYKFKYFSQRLPWRYRHFLLS